MREAIIAAGRRVFAEAALADASLRRIATLAGYSPEIIQQRFEDKQALFLAIGETALTAFAAAGEDRNRAPIARVRRSDVDEG